jgi:cytochrome b561
LHWLIALAILGLLAVGWIMTSLPNGPDKFVLFQLHKSVGITVMLLALARLAWRWFHPPPEMLQSMPPWEKQAARVTHVFLYILMIAMPFVGWVIVSASTMNIPTVLYGVIPWPQLPIIPDLTDKKEIGHMAGRIHGYLAWVIAVIVAGHAAAALKHHFIDRDNVLTRMAPEVFKRFFNRIRGA